MDCACVREEGDKGGSRLFDLGEDRGERSGRVLRGGTDRERGQMGDMLGEGRTLGEE